MMKRIFSLNAPVFAAALFLFPSYCFGQTVRDQIAQQASRLEKAVAPKSDTAEYWKDSKPEVKELLARVRASLDAGRTYLAVSELGRAWVFFGAIDALTSKLDTGKPELPAFEQEWKRTDQTLKALETRYSAESSTGISAAVRERAERSLETPDAKGLQAALVRLEQVIPAYFAAIGKAEPLAVAPGTRITLTLVRWPYT
jgi:hypothetical protein